MNDIINRELSRRKFIGACCAAVGSTGMLSALSQLRLIGAIADPRSGIPGALGAAGDYKALVCLFLAGGNDANNLIIPHDEAGFAAYTAARGALALPSDGLLGVSPKTSDGRAWAFHPSLGMEMSGASAGGLKGLFDSGQLAIVSNVGTLVVPTTKAQYNAKSVPLPPQLFSHNDQTVQWQSSVPDKPFSTGWGGRIADLVNAFNENNAISMSISLAGKNSFQVGKDVSQYAVSTSGAVQLLGTSGLAGGVRAAAQSELLAGSHTNLFESAFAGLTDGAIENSALLAAVLAANPAVATPFPTSNLGSQLSMIARLIKAAPSLGLKRQVFFARLGGWDLHDAQLTAHANLLADVSSSMKAFYDATMELGVADSVTTFTASDFGRTYNTNGDGSDHGWGSHHFVLGGAVNGGDLYGAMPDLLINGPDDTGRGRWIPTTSVDEFASTLALWFGVSESNLSLALPNIGRFAKPNLGFML
ncbi:MAG TPA: DUF1501 domain-containing protein [Opitutaceae bacterium]|nr:DUF1501 domain-containing protein [Opitutaceae bacterium]